MRCGEQERVVCGGPLLDVEHDRQAAAARRGADGRGEFGTVVVREHAVHVGDQPVGVGGAAPCAAYRPDER